jgi:hypothetical protein
MTAGSSDKIGRPPAVTPGKAAYDTWCADDDWHLLDDEARDLWEAAFRAGLDVYLRNAEAGP